jgi:hypothetical protein
MIVREFIELLKKLKPDAIILLSSDAEGNTFLPASGDYSIGKFDPESYEFWDKDDPYAKGKSALVLWPEHYTPPNS